MFKCIELINFDNASFFFCIIPYYYGKEKIESIHLKKAISYDGFNWLDIGIFKNCNN